MPPKGMEKDYFEKNYRPVIWTSLLGNVATTTPVCIKRRGTAMIVEWADGTHTKIVRPSDVEDAGLYTAFCIALAKKLYGNNSALKKAIHFADEERQLAAEQEIAEMKKQAHDERMLKQERKAIARSGRLARRQLRRDVIMGLINHVELNPAETEDTNDESEV